MGLPVREGMLLGGCRIEARVGEGGMGTVFRAHDENLDRSVAVKVMHPTADAETARRRFLAEAAAIARLDHPGIVRIYSFGEIEGCPYFLMEFVDGRPLRTFLTRVRTLHGGKHDLEELRSLGYLAPEDPQQPYFLRDPQTSPLTDREYPGRLAALAAELAEALTAAHGAGIIHRDLKPSNVLLTRAGRARLVDFGLVKQVGAEGLTAPDHRGFLGTLRYASPEQLAGRPVTPATDLFSLGLILFELATLRHPFGEEDADPRGFIARVLQGNVSDPREGNPHLSADFAHLITRCLQADPAARPAAAELAAALRSVPALHQSWTEDLGQFFSRFFRSFHASRGGTVRSGVATPGGDTPGPGPLEPGESPAGKEPLPADGSVPTTGSPGGSRTPSGRESPAAPVSPLEEMLQTARGRLFHEFAVGEAIELLNQALALEPSSVVALYNLSIALNAIGEHPLLAERLKGFPVDAPTWGEADRRRLAILRLLFLEQDFPQAEREVQAFRQRFPDQPDILWGMAFAVGAQGKLTQVLEVGRQIREAFPDDNLAPFLLSEAFEDAGRYDQAVEVLGESIRRFPSLHRIRLKIIGLLLFTGRHEDAEKHLSEAFGPSPTEDLALILRARLHLSRGKLPVAAQDLRTLLALSQNQALRAFASYMLYRIQTAGGQEKLAATCLSEAQALMPEACFRSLAEVRQRIAEHDCSGLLLAAEAAQPGGKGSLPWLEAALTVSRQVCSATLDLEAYLHGNFGRTTCLVFHPDGSWTRFFLFCQYSMEPREARLAAFRLPESPRLPFIDSQGRVLRMEIRDLPVGGGSGGVMVNLHLAEPLRPGGVEFILAELPVQPAPPLADGRRVFTLAPFPSTSARRQGLLVFLPEGLAEPWAYPAPDRRQPVPGGTLWIYERFLYGGESFVLQLTFPAV